jgi:arabinogalactan endo-1,4-beta-galactosidase
LSEINNQEFSDVKLDDYYYEALGIAKKLGISEGAGNNLFNPQSYITHDDTVSQGHEDCRET